MRHLIRLALVMAIACGWMTSLVRADDQPRTPGLAQGVGSAGRKKIVFISGPPSHGFAAHEHFAGCMLLARAINENVPGVEAVVYKHEWPKDEHAFDDAAAIVIYCDGGEGHVAIPHLKQLAALMDKGVGLGCIHYGVEVPKGEVGDDFLKWIGGYFETYWSVNPEWTANFTHVPQHEVTRGVRPFTIFDEWYYHMRFRPDMRGVTSILAAVPPDRTREGKDEPHGGNPFVRAGIGKNVSETVVWVATRDNGGRGFGCTGGHVHWNWAQDDFRKTILNSIAWIAHVEVPKDGIESKRPSVDDLLANQDEPIPANFDREAIQKRMDKMNAPRTAAR